MTFVGRNRAFGYSYFNCAHWRLTSELASKLLPLQPHAGSLSAYSSYNYSYPHGSLTLLAFDCLEYKTIHLRTSFSLRNSNSTPEQSSFPHYLQLPSRSVASLSRPQPWDLSLSGLVGLFWVMLKLGHLNWDTAQLDAFRRVAENE